MGSTTGINIDESAFEKANLGKLARTVNEAIQEISTKTSLPVSQVLEIMRNVRVEMVGEIREVVDSLGDSVDAVKHADAEILSSAIEDAIASISNATDLDTDEITWIFTKRPGADVEDIVSRLSAKSKSSRSLLSDRIGPEADRSQIVR